MKVIATNIQRFSLHDGPGIRTTVFFKGCNLKCPWCSNPENINFSIEKYMENGIDGVYGKEYTLEELYKEIIKDKDFFGEKGGVTFSGGECLWQFEKIEPLFKKLQDEGICICIETALIVPTNYVKIAMEYVDYFYVDMKIVDKKKEHIINSNVDLFIANLDELLNNNKKITIRIPVVPDYTYTKENIACITDILKTRSIKRVEIFKIHNLGEKKYRSLNKKMNQFKNVSDEEMEKLKKELEKYVKTVESISF